MEARLYEYSPAFAIGSLTDEVSALSTFVASKVRQRSLYQRKLTIVHSREGSQTFSIIYHLRSHSLLNGNTSHAYPALRSQVSQRNRITLPDQ
jgi:hypothetical protein